MPSTGERRVIFALLRKLRMTSLSGSSAGLRFWTSASIWSSGTSKISKLFPRPRDGEGGLVFVVARTLMEEQPESQIVLPLKVRRLKVVLRRGQVGAEEIHQRITLRDVLAELDMDLLDEGIKPGPDFAECIRVVPGPTIQDDLIRGAGSEARIGLRAGRGCEPLRLEPGCRGRRLTHPPRSEQARGRRS